MYDLWHTERFQNLSRHTVSKRLPTPTLDPKIRGVLRVGPGGARPLSHTASRGLQIVGFCFSIAFCFLQLLKFIADMHDK